MYELFRNNFDDDVHEWDSHPCAVMFEYHPLCKMCEYPCDREIDGKDAVYCYECRTECLISEMEGKE